MTTTSTGTDSRPATRNTDADRLRRKVRAAIKGMDRYWNTDDGDPDDLAAAMMVLRQTYARDLHAALKAEYQRGWASGYAKGRAER